MTSDYELTLHYDGTTEARKIDLDDLTETIGSLFDAAGLHEHPETIADCLWERARYGDERSLSGHGWRLVLVDQR